MSTINFQVDLSNGFDVSIGESPMIVSGNKLLLNLFEVILLSNKKQFVYNSKIVQDTNGGLEEALFDSNVTNNESALSISIVNCINKTVKIMQSDENSSTPNSERIKSATIIKMNKIDDSVSVVIDIVPAEYDYKVDTKVSLQLI